MSFRLILDKDDWRWYKQELDARHKYNHDHNGEPSRYPCAVTSNRYEPHVDAPYTFNHTIYYKDKNTCETCGHTTDGFPEHVKIGLKHSDEY